MMEAVAKVLRPGYLAKQLHEAIAMSDLRHHVGRADRHRGNHSEAVCGQINDDAQNRLVLRQPLFVEWRDNHVELLRHTIRLSSFVRPIILLSSADKKLSHQVSQ